MIKYLLAGLSMTGALAYAAPPAQHFFEPPQFKEAYISPSGRYLAVRVGSSSQRDGLLVLDSETRNVVGGARHDDNDISDISWVNDSRLVYTAYDRRVPPGEGYSPNMFAVNRDGKNRRQLAGYVWQSTGDGPQLTRRMEPPNTFLMREAGSQDSDYIYASRPIWDEHSYVVLRSELVRLNTVTGQASLLNRPTAPQWWMLDHKGQPSIMVSTKDGRETVHHNPGNGEWRSVATFAAYGGEGDGVAPIGFIDEKRMLVKTRLNGDKAALHTMDLASGKIDPQPLVSLGEFDFSGEVLYSNKKMLGFRYLADARGTVWFDAGMKATQAAVDKQLPGLVNLITPPAAPEVAWMLVESYSDRQPAIFSLYNSQTGELKVMGSSHPDINPNEMGRQDMVKITARDGLQFPAWLTLPAKAGKKLPLVVVVHGGPFVRGGELAWSPVRQFLASRGYAVLEPEFRGSTGFGHKLFKAGMKQWGLSMQADIADSVKWAVAQGVADAGRVCIMGGSYGGYATLMGLVNDGDTYRCGVAWSAVTDLPMMLDGSLSVLSDISGDYLKYGAPVLVGDVVKDAAQLNATSPLKQAARIKTPLLLAHGTNDRRVPYTHYTRMRSALKDNKADVEFVEYVDEGHGWSKLENHLDFWARVEKFLNKHIGNN